MSEHHQKVTISNDNGLHARPAGKIVALAIQFESDIKIHLDNKIADARSIIDLMTLTASCGCEVEVSAIGIDAEQAVNAIVELVEKRFEEQ